MYTIPWPTHLRCTLSLGPPVSDVHYPSAHPSPMYTIPRPTHLRCTLSLGPPICNVHYSSAHPSPMDTIPQPTHLHHTPSLGPPVSITHLIHYHLYSSTLYTFLYSFTIYTSGPSMSIGYTLHPRPTRITWYNYCHGPTSDGPSLLEHCQPRLPV